jgi:TolB-like protein/Flp pilus assembly protein TadD
MRGQAPSIIGRAAGIGFTTVAKPCFYPRVGIHLGDVVEESDGDLMGDGVNIAARLEGIARPGAICLSENAYRQVKSRLDLSVSDLGATQLKNIAEPIRVYSLEVGRPAQVRSPSASTPPRLSIVVLPFANLGGDPEQEYFVDGVTESLTTDLSRISGSFVIARNTAFTYKGKRFDVKQIGRELNVRYVLEGSIQRSSSRLRINVQLIDAETGAHLWAERFDKQVADLFEVQDEIVARLASQLDTQLIVAEALRAERAPEPDSMDLYFQGVAWRNKGLAPQHLIEARGFFERAFSLDPDNIDALVGMAQADAYMAINFLTEDRPAHFAKAEATLTKALSLAPNNALAHFLICCIQDRTNRAAQAVTECERAITLDRNLAFAQAEIGFAKIVLGRAEEAEAHVQAALRLSPRDTNAFIWIAIVGSAKLHLGADEEAVMWLRRSNEANRNHPIAHFYLAAALARLGRLDEARDAMHAGLALNPGFTLRRYRAGAYTDNPTYLTQRELVCEALRKAGVPEG